MPATLQPSSAFSVEEFLAQEHDKDILRFSTAGSVDDGKSTLIGRLLYDTQSVYDDQVRSIEGKGTVAPGQIDFALLTDGLRAEREQGITIDVAYRYFSTARRKFIIADTPGHEQYTRNMATGASTADAAVVLVDARKGVLLQSRRHAYIASLLGVRHILVAVNKMDLVAYDERIFDTIKAEFTAVLAQIAERTASGAEAHFIPVSALAGDNLVHRSTAMPWYRGASLLQLLETLPARAESHGAPFRYSVQRVLRPSENFRGFAGQIASGTVRPGDRLTVLPSGRSAHVARIVTYDGDLKQAQAPLSVTLVLDRELDISRGDLLVSSDAPATLAQQCRAALVWMDQQPLSRGQRYLLKHTSQTVPAVVEELCYRTDLATLTDVPAETLEMNGIGVAQLRLLRPIAVDPYTENRATGAFILIDPDTNRTVAAGMVLAAVPPHIPSSIAGRVTAQERAARWGHRGAVLSLNGPAVLIDEAERSLFSSGAITVRIDAAEDGAEERASALAQLGILSLLTTESKAQGLTARVHATDIVIDAEDAGSAGQAVHELLTRAGVLTSPHTGAGKEGSH